MEDKRSWWQRIFGRSIIKALLGDFFVNKNNTASLVAIILVLTVCYLVIVEKQYSYVDALMNTLFVIIGYYFGAKDSSNNEGDKDEK